MPSAGGRVGAGIYFASEANKSGNYVNGASDGSAIMFLSEVVLGKQFEVHADGRHASSLRKAPPGYDSVVALGRYRPDPAKDVLVPCGLRNVPLACTKSTKRKVKDPASASSFFQDEYLVYDEAQVQLRYMVRIQL